MHALAHDLEKVILKGAPAGYGRGAGLQVDPPCGRNRMARPARVMPRVPEALQISRWRL
jgi:hypothetical protein